jgi:hypothetical protein
MTLKIRAPTGWVIVKWKDKVGKTWVNTIPKGGLKHIRRQAKKLNAKILKVWR